MVLGSTKLRRKLFLEPVATKEYFEGIEEEQVRNPRSTLEPAIGELRYTITRMVVEAHPVLMAGLDSEIDDRIELELPSLEKLQAVPPSTLLFQPPLETVHFCSECGLMHKHSPTGLTFGMVVDASKLLKESFKGIVKFCIYDAVLHDAHPVIQARKALGDGTQSCKCARCRKDNDTA